MADYTVQGQAAPLIGDAATTLGSGGVQTALPDKEDKRSNTFGDKAHNALGLDSPQQLYGDKKRKKAPKAPSYDDIIAADKASSAFWESAGRDMLTWAKENDAFNRGIFSNVFGVQEQAMNDAYADARKDRARYDDTYIPAVDDLVKRFNEYDSPERRDAEAARVVADSQSNYEAQRQNSLAALEGYGIDPSQTRFKAVDLAARTATAAQAAGQANQARRAVEQQGLALRSAGVDLLGQKSALQDTAQQGMGLASNIGQAAVGETTAVTGASRDAFALPVAYGGVAAANRGAAVDTINTQYQNKLQAAGLDAQQAAGNAQAAGSAIGGIFGAIYGGPGGAAAGSQVGGAVGQQVGGSEDGGIVTQQPTALPGPTDTVPMMLAPGEFVVPANVVKMKGREFFDRMVAKYAEDGATALPERKHA